MAESARRRGRPRAEVPADEVEELVEQGLRLEGLEARLKAQRVAAAELAKKHYAMGVPKRVIAEALGITRVTLDAWLRRPDEVQ
ncbi:MAG: hypothetical protein QG597_3678 [Actinomycetota bacterium]|nr:hypothetical protein [Actinomycetota bacterium]